MKQNLDALTSLRFFAALAIIIVHAKEYFKVTSGISSNLPFGCAVSFFFVLSGFILTYVYQDISRPGAIKSFYVARVAKIWPLHLTTLALILLLCPWSQLVGANNILVGVLNSLLLQSWVPIPNYFFSFNSVAWSISTEFSFYLIFPILAMNWHRTWHWKSVVVFLFVAVNITLIGVLHLRPYDPTQLTHLTDLYVIISPFTRIGEFVCGMLAGRLFILLNAGKIFDGRFWWTGFEIVSIAFSWYCATHALLLPNWIAGRDLGPSIWNTYLSSCGAAPGFTLLIVVFAFQKGVISKAIAVWPLVVLGEMSFAIYLEHQILLRYLFSHHTIFSHLPDKVQCIVYCGLVLGLAFVLWSFVEKPSRDFIRKAYLYRQQRAANKLLVTA